MMNIETLTPTEFVELPLVIEGESKEVRYAGDGEAVIRLKPTIYSYTHNRGGEIAGSDALRLRAIQALLPVLRQAGIAHTYIDVNDRWIKSRLVLQAPCVGAERFVPDDLSAAEVASLPVAPPLEVVAKARHSGTPKHRYFEFDRQQVRGNHPRFPGLGFANDEPYPEPFVRFDWRNPLTDTAGNRLADEVLPEAMADWFIDAPQAIKTARIAFDALRGHFRERNLELWDICFFVAEDGKTMFGEVSPDCMRVRAADGSSLDKDVWRQGGSSDQVLQKWQTLVDRLN